MALLSDILDPRRRFEVRWSGYPSETTDPIIPAMMGWAKEQMSDRLALLQGK